MLHVDPRFDVFRKLDPRETPPSIGQIFGEPRVLAVLPSAAPAAELQAWRELFKGWLSAEPRDRGEARHRGGRRCRADRAVWIAGRGNRWAARLFTSGGGMTLDRVGDRGGRREDGAGRPHARADRPTPAERREGDRASGRRPRGGVPRSRPQAPALREVLLPRLRGRRAGQRAERAVAADRLAAACGRARPDGPPRDRRGSRRRSASAARTASRGPAQGARRVAADLLAEGWISGKAT